MGVHPGADLAVQLPGLQLYAEEQDKHNINQGPGTGPLSNWNAIVVQGGKLKVGTEGESTSQITRQFIIF